MDVHAILEAVYRIQGLSDSSHPAKSLEERMAEIFDLACDIMRRTGFQPD